MKLAYKFSNLLGTVYRKGQLNFTPDGNSIISPVGNRLSIFDLKNNKSETLPIESQYNFTAVGLSPDGRLAIAVNEEGEALLISLVSRSVINTYHFHSTVHSLCFSPDGKKFAVTKNNTVLVFHAPGKTREFNPFVLYRTYYGAYDETLSINWTSDSKAFVVGCADMNTRVYAADYFSNLVIMSLGAQTDKIINAFFHRDSLNVYSVAANARLVVWTCDTALSDLKPLQRKLSTSKTSGNSKSTADDASESGEEEEESSKTSEKREKEREKAALDKAVDHIKYKKPKRINYFTKEEMFKNPRRVSSAAFNARLHLLVTGFEDGGFFLHEMPDFNLIHSLSIAQQSIASMAFNVTGEWLAIGCSGLGQLLVWEWQSESYILKQQGHFNSMSSVAYSPDGMYVATGGQDGKVKVWNTLSGFCFVTFNEHLAGISGVTFNQNGKVVLSASLDGTVRAFDLNRYRNFRTFTSPRPVQFSCLAVDHSGDIVAAGANDHFEIYVWSMQTGRLLEILAGHEGPVCSLAFPTSGHAMLASGSWDKTVKLWDIFESKGSKETIRLNSDVMAVTFKPDGEEIAVATINAQVSFWNARNCTQTGSIEGRHDLGYMRKDTDKISAKKTAMAKAFQTLCYTADGSCILAAGQSKNICIYSVTDQILIKKFEITQNKSLDGTQEFLDRRQMTEFGSLALVDEETGKSISLPGVREGNMADRAFKPEVRVSCVRFSPTGRAFVATTTEGLMLYSLDHNLVFDPFQLEMDITPQSVRQTLSNGEYSTALMMAFKLNEQALTQEVFESIPFGDTAVIIQGLPDVYVDKSLAFVASQLESSRHIEFYLNWCQQLLVIHGTKLKQRSPHVMATLRAAQKALSRRFNELSSLCDHNKYSMQYILSLAELKKKRTNTDMDSEPTETTHKLKLRTKKTSDQSNLEALNQSDASDDDDDDLMQMIRDKALNESDFDEESMET